MTGGADSMVHAFALLDLVEQKAANKAKAIQPIRTWSKHYLPVTALTPLTSGRMASASEDGQVVVMEVFSEATLATIQMPQAIRVLTSQDHRLFAGDKHGSIYLIDLDEYAVQKTAQLGAIVKQKNIAGSGSTKTSVKRVFAGEGATLPESISKSRISSMNQTDASEGAESIYCNGKVYTGYYKKFHALLQADRDKVMAERERQGIKKGPQKKTGCQVLFAKTTEKELAATKRKLKKANRKISSLHTKGDSESNNSTNGDEPSNNGGNSFGGREEKKKGKKSK
jgi:hypothetical protein